MTSQPPHRQQTDQSLRSEREKTDRELEQKRAEIEEDSDQVLDRARERAGDVLEAARAKADEKGAGPTGAIRDERREEDRALETERKIEAAQLASEREARRRVLTELLRSERNLTDEDLLRERRGTDAALLTRDDFLAMVSHDLRGLLGAIVMGTGLILKDAPPGGDERSKNLTQRVEGIQRFTGRMNRLLNDLLDVVSIEAGRLAIAPAPAQVKQLVHDAAEPFQSAAAAREVELVVLVPDDLPEAAFDSGRVLQVLTNLLSNALKFTKGPGRVELSVRCEGDHLAFYVRDNGPGIPEDKQEAIFERFRQVDTHDRRGHGLGLHISRSIVEAHGGEIGVESTPGQGSTFFFTLPLDAQPKGPSTSSGDRDHRSA